MEFIKRPKTIQAIQWSGLYEDVSEIVKFVSQHIEKPVDKFAAAPGFLYQVHLMPLDNSEVEESRPRIRIESILVDQNKYGEIVLWPEDWLMFRDGRFDLMPNPKFHLYYSEAPKPETANEVLVPELPWKCPKESCLFEIHWMDDPRGALQIIEQHFVNQHSGEAKESEFDWQCPIGDCDWVIVKGALKPREVRIEVRRHLRSEHPERDIREFGGLDG